MALHSLPKQVHMPPANRCLALLGGELHDPRTAADSEALGPAGLSGTTPVRGSSVGGERRCCTWCGYKKQWRSRKMEGEKDVEFNSS